MSNHFPHEGDAGLLAATPWLGHISWMDGAHCALPRRCQLTLDVVLPSPSSTLATQAVVLHPNDGSASIHLKEISVVEEARYSAAAAGLNLTCRSAAVFGSA